MLYHVWIYYSTLNPTQNLGISVKKKQTWDNTFAETAMPC